MGWVVDNSASAVVVAVCTHGLERTISGSRHMLENKYNHYTCNMKRGEWKKMTRGEALYHINNQI